jgi:hypothetical protein
MGNNDDKNPKAKKPATSLTAAAPLWHAFVTNITSKQPVAAFKAPKGVVRAKIDAWTGGRPGPWTRDTVTEWFIDGTQPGGRDAVDRAGLLYSRSCGSWAVDPVRAELGPRLWDHDVMNWVDRARKGVGVAGPYGTKTAYFWGRTGWGGPLVGPCAPKPKPKAHKPPKDTSPPGHGGGPGGGGGHGGGGGGGGAGAQPTPSPAPLPGP